MKSEDGGTGKRGWGREGAYSFVACLCNLTVDHASLSRRGGGKADAIDLPYR